MRKYPRVYCYFSPKARDILRNGGIGVIPTDTLYGIVGSALHKETVDRIYKLRKRNRKKPMIIIIGSLRDLKMFKIRLTSFSSELIKKFWPGPVSLIFPCLSSKFFYLHRGTYSLAFRLPKDYRLRIFLNKTGPLVAPSANPEGKPPSKTIKEAIRYFDHKVDFYIDKGRKKNPPSALFRIEDRRIERLR